AVAGNAGQCDYSFANHFMDSFAAGRERLRANGTRSGKSLSINWSLWADGGMKLDEQTELFFRKTLGIKALSTATGLDAFVRSLASERTQFAVLEGIQEKVEVAWGLRKKAAPPIAPPGPLATASAPIAGEGDLAAWLQNGLSQIVMEFLKLDADDVSPDKILLDLGFDSIGLTTFANAVNDKYQLDITPVLFFDYPSISEIAKHLAVERKDELLGIYRGSATIPTTAAQAVATQPLQSAPKLEISKGWNPAALDREAAPALSAGEFSPELRFVHMPMAIVGMSGVMPQSEDLDEFWENLKSSKDMVTVIPPDRWRWEDYYGDPLKETNKSNSKWGGFMKEIDKFDPLFFGISPREAQMMDPQQRLFLEHVWKAVEDSGQKVSDLAGTKTGVFVGVATSDYTEVMNDHGIVLDGYTASGNSHSILANRVSFLLNLRGPSAPIDTACSSSLVALHRAIESIHTGSSDMAIVGGVQVMLSPAAYISFGMAGMLSGDGKCKTFDKGANGYVRGEGCGAIFIKSLAAAEADGNHIYAVIKSTAENHGGRVTTLTAPNSAAQSELLIEAYEKAHVDPTTVGYIECHGTGTTLGDPIEIQALTKAFSELYKRNNKAPAETPHCGLSSVKTNIGHLETAAGISGLLKALLAIKHKQIPANIHFEEVNPYINLKGTPFYIADRLTPWTAATNDDGTSIPRRAGVSSFGFGGANAHIVLEEYVPPARRRIVEANAPHLIVLSAKNEARLKAYAQSVLAYLDKEPVELLDLAYTLQVGRDEMPERLALVVSSVEELKQQLAGDGGYRGNIRSKTKAPQAAGAEGEALVQSAVQRNDLSALAELWVSGAKIEWRRLHETSAPERISAPTYPFARERHWISDVERVPKPALRPVIEAVPQLTSRLQSLVPAWTPAPIHSGERIVVPQATRILLLGGDREHLDWVRKDYPDAQHLQLASNSSVDVIEKELRVRAFDQLLWIAPDSHDERIIEQQEEGVLGLFRIIKALLNSGYATKPLQWTVVTSLTQRVANEPIHSAHAGIAGLIGSLAKESPRWNLRLLDVESLASVAASECLSLPWDKQGNALAHRRGEWFREELAAITAVPQPTQGYRQHGVYVVIGGAGGIGEVWSRYMIEQYEADIIWIGRRPYDSTIEAKLNSLTRLGRAPRYISADATNREALEQALQTILMTHPAIHGVVHSAIVLRDQSLARMDEAAFRASLSAKVDISVNMDRVFGGQELDFMLFFSSIISFFKSPGQSNYSAGCTFKDSFAQSIRQTRAYPVKVMNWGYWGSVGVAADATHNRIMEQMGIGSIEPGEGMAALQALVGSDVPQMILIKTLDSEATAGLSLSEAIAHHLTKRLPAPAAVPVRAKPATNVAERAGHQYVQRIITEKLSDALRLEASMIQEDLPLAEYGVDSIIGVNLVQTINETLGIELEPSKLFEYDTLEQLTDYIATEWHIEIEERLAGEVSTDPIAVMGMSASTDDEVLANVLWRESALDDSYEKVTF
ncbi:MAG TPA: SDR family NAD(P)-dependent oxidoreductase, partial [Thermoanaerobaculia bacterium]|nr:SDR family NAD(P)-dependent oxidoreductase [Thermoanaerobaculia bacterium]